DDGDLDLFVQELTGEVMFFEHVAGDDAPDGTGAAGDDAHRFVWRSDRFRDLDVGEWYRFADVDGDGDQDLLAERRHSYIRYFRNVGTPSEAEFAALEDSLRSAEGEPLFSDRQNVPNVGDVDCDGLPDLLIGRLDGTISRFEMVEGSGAGADASDEGARGDPGSRERRAPPPRFRHVTDRFEGIEIVNPLVSLHGANSLSLVDFDGDGDQDLFWGDYFERGLLYIENTGTCDDPYLGSPPTAFPEDDPLETSGYNAPAVGDVDGDGDLDLLVGVLGGAFNPTRTADDNLYFLDGSGEGFELRTRRFLDGIDVGSESTPALGDLDGDGDLDLLLANKIDPDEGSTSLIHRFENRGTPERPDFRKVEPLSIQGRYQYSPALADLDGDGRDDLVLGSFRGRVALYRNEGPGEGFTLADSVLVELTRGSHTTPALGDLDADGDLDLMVGEASGTLNYYRNTGTPTSPDFELVSDEYGGIDVGRRSSPALVDLDGDGDLDLVVGSEDDGIFYFRNDGDASSPDFVEAGRLEVAERGAATPVFGDVDDDGTLELFVGTSAGGLLYFRDAAAARDDGARDGSR
ncbi:MAG: FG-GAP-like repeat-containing protein, partial [Gemmatimonadota bacterium]